MEYSEQLLHIKPSALSSRPSRGRSTRRGEPTTCLTSPSEAASSARWRWWTDTSWKLRPLRCGRRRGSTATSRLSSGPRSRRWTSGELTCFRLVDAVSRDPTEPRPLCPLCSPPAQNISAWTWGDYQWFVTGKTHQWLVGLFLTPPSHLAPPHRETRVLRRESPQ